MARLTSPTGATVVVADDKVDELLRRGFTSEGAAKKATKKSSSSRTSK